MTANPFFPLDEMSTESDHTEMMVFPQVDQSIYERRRQMVDTVVDYKEMRMRYSCAIKYLQALCGAMNWVVAVRALQTLPATQTTCGQVPQVQIHMLFQT